MSAGNDEMMLLLGRVEGKVDTIISTQTVQAVQLETLRTRITTLEGFKSWILGAAAAVGVAASWFTNLAQGGFKNG